MNRNMEWFTKLGYLNKDWLFLLETGNHVFHHVLVMGGFQWIWSSGLDLFRKNGEMRQGNGKKTLRRNGARWCKGNPGGLMPNHQQCDMHLETTALKQQNMRSAFHISRAKKATKITSTCGFMEPISIWIVQPTKVKIGNDTFYKFMRSDFVHPPNPPEGASTEFADVHRTISPLLVTILTCGPTVPTPSNMFHHVSLSPLNTTHVHTSQWLDVSCKPWMFSIKHISFP